MNDAKHIQQATFEESDFKGVGFSVDCLRWWRQFIALSEKNFLIYWRRPRYLLCSLVLPSLAILIFFLGNSNPSSDSSKPAVLQEPSRLQGLGPCHSYYEDRCLQVAFAPTDPYVLDVMHQVADFNNLKFGADIRGFNNEIALQVAF